MNICLVLHLYNYWGAIIENIILSDNIKIEDNIILDNLLKKLEE